MLVCSNYDSMSHCVLSCGNQVSKSHCVLGCYGSIFPLVTWLRQFRFQFSLCARLRQLRFHVSLCARLQQLRSVAEGGGAEKEHNGKGGMPEPHGRAKLGLEVGVLGGCCKVSERKHPLHLYINALIHAMLCKCVAWANLTTYTSGHVFLTCSCTRSDTRNQVVCI